MSKIDSFEFRGQPQEVIDFKNQVTTLLNFGKYQGQVVSAVPNWAGRRGEHVWYVNGTDGRLYVSTVDQGTNWTEVITFTAVSA